MITTEYHITIDQDGVTAIDWLAKAMTTEGLSRGAIKIIMQKGCVWVETQDAQEQRYTQRLRRAKKVLKQADILHCYYDEKVLDKQPPSAILVSDEGGYSIWNKPAGMLSQGSKWGDHCTIYRWAEQHLQPERPAFIVHRLDRAASGLIILAHKKQVASQFSAMFQQRLINKHYLVHVKGDFSKEIPADKQTLMVINKLDGKHAVSHIRLRDYSKSKDISLLEVSIETGRKHQIRKHLSELAYPVIGDRLYGAETESNEELQLTATKISFKCPITQEQKVYLL